MYKKNYIKIIKNISNIKGLTLVELIVVISIFMIITSVAIFNYGNFNSTVSLQNLTDDIALSIRKAQGFAIGARGVEEGVGPDKVFNFNNSYGMHFSVDPNPTGSLSGSNKSFLMFTVPIPVDKSTVYDKKYVYDESANAVCNDGVNKCVELFNINTIDEIKDIKIDGVSKASGSIDIVFTRPDPRANFCYRTSLSSSCNSDISDVEIVLSNGQTDEQFRTKTITIQNTGQISIQ
ncbi:MAG: prepilin-type N-terminal cleavage/methylation domain-containing protein [Candidatus Nomurabacteria bacterium]